MPHTIVELPSLDALLRHNPGWLDEAVDTAEASRITGFPVATLNTWRSSGEGPPFLKINASVRYQRRTLFAWLAEHQRRNTADHGGAS